MHQNIKFTHFNYNWLSNLKKKWFEINNDLKCLAIYRDYFDNTKWKPMQVDIKLKLSPTSSLWALNKYSTQHEICSPHRGSSSVENPRCPPWVSVFHGVLFFYTQKSTETHGGSRSDIDSRALSGPPSVWKISNCL